MGDAGDGWQTVMPTSQSGIGRLPQDQLEAYEKQILREWETSRGHWSGIGKHTPLNEFSEAKRLHLRFRQPHDRLLGSGSFGLVEKVIFTHNNRTICLARKLVRPPHRRFPIGLLREEANVMEKLDHDHIVKLVGTYCIRSNDLYILLWPVAVCNLDTLFGDIHSLLTGEGDREDIVGRLHALELHDLSAVENQRAMAQAQGNQGNCPLHYLKRIMGCISRAVAYCHQADVRHLDLKPSNILLNPGRVYLADFGIAKDVHDRDHTMTRGQVGTPKWRAPELHQSREDWSMKAADVYSLGLVLLNIAAVIYGADLDEFDTVIGDLTPQGRENKLGDFLGKVEKVAIASRDVGDVSAPTFGPKHVVHLVSRMVSSSPSLRPVIFQVDSELAELGGIEQVYHFPCCKRSTRFMTERVNARLQAVVEERNRLLGENAAMAKQLTALRGMDETYQSRLEKQEKKHAESIALLQEQLDKERKERKRESIALLQEQLDKERKERRRLEARVAELQRKPARPGIPRPVTTPAVCQASPSSAGLTMRARPPTHPLPKALVQSPPLPSQTQIPSPAVKMVSRLKSYSQAAAATPTTTIRGPAAATPAPATAAAGSIQENAPDSSATAIPAAPAPPSPLAPVTVHTQQLSPGAVRRGSMIRSSVSPSPAPVSSASPNPDMAGFTLRSRGSGSRLPRAIPATPTRSNTPITPVLHRDPSSTDSTQYSMASSTFSLGRISAHSRGSLAETSVAGTPAFGSPAVNNLSDSMDLGRSRDSLYAEPSSQDSGLGLGIDLPDQDMIVAESIDGVRNAANARDATSLRDTASVVSSVAAPGTATGISSPVLATSALSSPRISHASLEGHRSGMFGVPSLLTQPSWADVAGGKIRG